DSGQGDALVRQRIEEIEARGKHFEASGNDRFVSPRRWFQLTGHFDPRLFSGDESDRVFLVLEVRHQARNNYLQNADAPAYYENTLTCIRKKIPWRPGLGFNSTPHRIDGPQTATVVTPDGEEIYTDEYGRVHVQFHWDRVGRYDLGSSAAVRVATPVAGRDFGLLGVPRKGQEVVVFWLGGDPDRPIITNVVANADNMPPRFSHQPGLPANRFLSGWRSREIGGMALQQLRFDDSTGKTNTQLGSDHANTQINLGHLGTQMNEGETAPRGEGLEARTAAALALRGEQGVLISADKLPGEGSPMLERSPLIGLAEVLQSIQQQLAQLATTHQTGALDGRKLTQFIEHLKDWENGSNTAPEAAGGGMPMVVATAPSTIALASADNLLLGAQTNIDAVSAGDTHLTAGRGMLLHAGEGFNVFALAKGVKVVTAQDDIDIEAHAGNIVATASNTLVLRAGVEIRFEAPTVRTVTEGAQVDVGGGQITQQSSGAHVIKSASFAQVGPGGGSPPGLNLPSSHMTTDERGRVTRAGEPLPGRRYTAFSTVDGREVGSGVTDAQGFTAPFHGISIETLNIVVHPEESGDPS
ncbi:MAG TPA: type VI secretion system tip protein TssI/VgrG, partial [Burkholderiaceae bacterium]|nr:type VI secretion system tip protein TssI/VgrG [Burkholderiaceae bacterium]